MLYIIPQRVLNDLWRARLSSGRMIWLPEHPPPHPSSKLDQRNIGRTEKKIELADGRGRRGWARSRIIRPQERLILYKSFNTLWFTRTSAVPLGKSKTSKPELCTSGASGPRKYTQ